MEKRGCLCLAVAAAASRRFHNEIVSFSFYLFLTDSFNNDNCFSLLNCNMQITRILYFQTVSIHQPFGNGLSRRETLKTT